MTSILATLSAARIAALSAAHAAAVEIRIVHSTGSTNADLLAAIHADPQHRPTLLVAQIQTAGRGRAGRVWQSVPEQALTFSLAWKLQCSLQDLVGLPLAVGVALADALASLQQEVQLKWPNDVLQNGAKLAGVLIETVSDKTADATWVVVGIGVNLALPPALPDGRVCAGAPALLALEREQLLAVLLNHLSAALLAFEQHGFAAFATRWNARHAYAGCAVQVIDQGRILQQGIACGVDAVGRLLLATAAGQVAVVSGDVSLRLESTQNLTARP